MTGIRETALDGALQGVLLETAQGSGLGLTRRRQDKRDAEKEKDTSLSLWEGVGGRGWSVRASDQPTRGGGYPIHLCTSGRLP
jgi:hypothetical protein